MPIISVGFIPLVPFNAEGSPDPVPAPALALDSDTLGAGLGC